jgi:selenocysteine lyase/cysteine desulfurase
VREWLKDRRGVGVFKIALPEPATRQAILDAYAKAISETPRLGLILLTHLSHRTGPVIPVKEIAAMAREKNNARSFCLAEPGCGIELDAADIIGGMASSVDHWIPLFAG